MIIKTNKELAALIKARREDKGILKHKLRQDAAISNTTHDRLESEGVGTISTILRVLDALGMVLDVKDKDV